MNGLELEQNRGYCAVRFEPNLRDMSWGEVEKTTGDVVNRLKEIKASRLLIDLSRMEMIHSGLVAALVRIWKAIDARDSKVVVVSANEVVTEVIRSAGLLKLFSVFSTREDAAYELGVSPVAQMEQREHRVVAWAALPSALLAVTALGPLFLHSDVTVQWNAELIGAMLAGFACVTGILSLVTDRAWRRWLGLLAMIIGIGVLTTLWFRRFPLNPVAPEADTEATESDTKPADPTNAAPPASSGAPEASAPRDEPSSPPTPPTTSEDGASSSTSPVVPATSAPPPSKSSAPPNASAPPVSSGAPSSAPLPSTPPTAESSAPVPAPSVAAPPPPAPVGDPAP
ncbi:MAG: STAS domain-containing protein [Planctomycetaceae bacterium]